MTPAAALLLRRLRRAWRTRTLVRALALGAALALSLAAVLLLFDDVAPLPRAWRIAASWVVAACAVAPLAWAGLRVARAPTQSRLALLAEERDPRLHGWVTTALEPPSTPLAAAFASRAESRIAGASVDLRVAERAPLVRALGALVLLALVVAAAGGPADALAGWTRPDAADRVPGLATRVRNDRPVAPVFDALRITVRPPRYTGRDAERTGEPVAALAGSRIEVDGPLPVTADGVVVRSIPAVDEAAAALSGGEWSATVTASLALRGLELIATAAGDTIARRVVPVLVAADAPPRVELLDPAGDQLLAAATPLDVTARARDDFGVADLRLAWILSSGSGESYAFREGTSPLIVERSDDALTGRVRLDLAALGLDPGDVLHIRAVARDANDVTGPGVGVSETRVIRIAREEEYGDVTALTGFPIEAEVNPILSQRMIVLLTERLRDRASRMDAGAIRTEAERIAGEQARLRGRVGELIFDRAEPALDAGTFEPGHDGDDHDARDPLDPQAVLEAASEATGGGTPEEFAHTHDEAPVLAVDQPLLDAYNAMFEAERELRQTAPAAALPHEYRALEILQRIRAAERVYSRAPVTVPPLDLAAARGTGELDDARPATRAAAMAAQDPDAAVADIDAALARSRASLSDASLLLGRAAVAALSNDAADPRAGALLARAAQAAARGDTTALRRDAAAARALLARATSTSAAMHTRAPASPTEAAYLQSLAPALAPARAPAPARRFVFATARYHSGDWDSAPLVPANLTHSLAQYTGIPVDESPVVVSLDDEEIFEHPFLYMTGHLPVRFDQAETRNLRAFVERGGLLFIDDHNHDIDGAFHRTAVAELERIFGAGALRPLPNDHELYRVFFVFEDGPPTTSHELNGWGDGLIHEQLLAIERDGRIAVLYSNKDYSSEWSYHADNKRFNAIDNTRFGVNILVYALTR